MEFHPDRQRNDAADVEQELSGEDLDQIAFAQV